MNEITTTNQAGPAAILEVISRAASDEHCDIEKMERLMQMHSKMMADQAQTAYYAALAEMQCDLPEVKERGEIRHGNKVISTYPKWEDVNEAIKPVMKDHGFALSFRVETGDKVKVTGVLSHRDGHRESTEITLPADTSGSKNPVQAVSSSVSYGKRYTAGALLNLTSRGEDDDGRAAGQYETISSAQLSTLLDLVNESGADLTRFCRAMQVDRLESMRATEYDNAVSALRRKMATK